LTIWKKSISTVMSAALLASLLATAVAPAAFAAADNTGALECAVALDPTTCSQVADGASLVKLFGTAIDWDADTAGVQIPPEGTVLVTVDAPAFSAAANFVLSTDKKSATFDLTGANNLGGGDQLWLTAPTIAGASLVTVVHKSVPDAVTGVVTTTSLGSLTVTWTATSALGVSEANSTVKFVASADSCAAAAVTASAPKGTNPAAKLCVLVKNAAGSIVTTATVGVQITPIGLTAAAVADAVAAPAGTAQVASTGVNTIPGWYAFSIGGSNLAGVATVKISVTLSGVTTTFAPKTYTFSDVLATITATSEVLAVYYDGGWAHAVFFTAKDAAGNKVAADGANTFSSDTTVLDIDGVVPYLGGTAPGEVDVFCKKVGSANVVVKQGAIASNAIKVYCSDVPDSFTVAFDKTTVAPGGSAKLTVTVIDENGQPAVGCELNGVAKARNGFCDDVGVIVSSGAITPQFASIGNGATVHTYLAPFNVGVATALVTVWDLDSKSASINIGQVIPPAGSATNASARGAYVPPPPMVSILLSTLTRSSRTKSRRFNASVMCCRKCNQCVAGVLSRLPAD